MDRSPDVVRNASNDNILEFNVPGIEQEDFEVFGRKYSVPDPDKIFERGRNTFLTLQERGGNIAGNTMTTYLQLAGALYNVRSSLRQAEEFASAAMECAQRSHEGIAEMLLRSRATRAEKNAIGWLERCQPFFKLISGIEKGRTD
ncbi:MAG: hypothetical protein G01um10148_867 [Parcubacteria group bacterium Gr01-1014_8]|nr:MAG: hypothetical protein G01um10148_867 [Parcubacteria group bacterium Gr01-1014_8]